MTAALPVYGKQYIRFMESGTVPDASTIAAFTAVTINPAPAALEPPRLGQAVGAGEIFGIIQQRFNPSTSGFATDLNRQASVATSGLLLVRANGGAMPAQNDALKIGAGGLADSGGGAVTVDGTTPIVRHRVEVGGENFVLVSFN
jgi:hypothetical protein